MSKKQEIQKLRELKKELESMQEKPGLKPICISAHILLIDAYLKRGINNAKKIHSNTIYS